MERLDDGGSSMPGEPLVDLAETGAAVAAWRELRGGAGQVGVQERRADGVVEPTGAERRRRGRGRPDRDGRLGPRRRDRRLDAGQRRQRRRSPAPSSTRRPIRSSSCSPDGWQRKPTGPRSPGTAATNAIGGVRYSVSVDDEPVREGLQRLHARGSQRDDIGDGRHRIQIFATDDAGQETGSRDGHAAGRPTPAEVELSRRGRRLAVVVSDGRKGQASGLRRGVGHGDGLLRRDGGRRREAAAGHLRAGAKARRRSRRRPRRATPTRAPRPLPGAGQRPRPRRQRDRASSAVVRIAMSAARSGSCSPLAALLALRFRPAPAASATPPTLRRRRPDRLRRLRAARAGRRLDRLRGDLRRWPLRRDPDAAPGTSSPTTTPTRRASTGPAASSASSWQTKALEKVADGDLFDEATNDFLRRGASNPSISADGRYVAFATAEPLVPADLNDNVDVYVRDMAVADRQPGAYDLVSARDGGGHAGELRTAAGPVPGQRTRRRALPRGRDQRRRAAGRLPHRSSPPTCPRAAPSTCRPGRSSSATAAPTRPRWSPRSGTRKPAR